MKELVTSKQTARQAARLFASHSGSQPHRGSAPGERCGLVTTCHQSTQCSASWATISARAVPTRQRRLMAGGSRWTPSNKARDRLDLTAGGL